MTFLKRIATRPPITRKKVGYIAPAINKRAVKFAAAFAKEHSAGTINTDQVESIARWALEPFDRGERSNDAQGPYQIQHELQVKMQELVGIVRTESEMLMALEELAKLQR